MTKLYTCTYSTCISCTLFIYIFSIFNIVSGHSRRYEYVQFCVCGVRRLWCGWTKQLKPGKEKKKKFIVV